MAENMTKTVRYTEVSYIGEGMSSKVYKSWDNQLNNWVALKLMNPHLANDQVGIERFKREIQITRMVNDPRIIKIFDLKKNSKGLYLVMEYLDGRDLSDTIKLNGPMSVETVISFLTNILETLSSCHEKNIIHRDLKPQNIFVQGDNSIKILDFGISRMTGLSDLTQTGTSLGSPEYMAPELFANNTFDTRTDLYAIGIMAYEMLIGELPFKGDSIAILFKQHVMEPVPTMSEKRDDIPKWLSDIIMKLLDKNPIHRYQSTQEALHDIEHKTVIFSESISLDKRECLKCNEDTLQSLPICLSCGYGSAEKNNKNKKDRYNLIFTNNGDMECLNHYAKKKINHQKKINMSAFKEIKVAGNLTYEEAKLLQKDASKHGVFLETRKKGIVSLFRYYYGVLIASFLLLVPTALMWFMTLIEVFRYSSRHGILKGIVMLTNEKFYIFQEGVLILFLLSLPILWLWYLRSVFKKPLFGNDSKLNAESKNTFWYGEICKNIQLNKFASFKEADAHIIERYLFFKKQIVDLTSDHQEKLDRLLVNFMNLTEVMSILAKSIDERRILIHSGTNSEELFQETMDLEEKLSQLNNKLIYLNSIFNGLIAQMYGEESLTLLDSIEDSKQLIEDTKVELDAIKDLKLMIEEAA